MKSDVLQKQNAFKFLLFINKEQNVQKYAMSDETAACMLTSI